MVVGRVEARKRLRLRPLLRHRLGPGQRCRRQAGPAGAGLDRRRCGDRAVAHRRRGRAHLLRPRLPARARELRRARRRSGGGPRPAALPAHVLARRHHFLPPLLLHQRPRRRAPGRRKRLRSHPRHTPRACAGGAYRRRPRRPPRRADRPLWLSHPLARTRRARRLADRGKDPRRRRAAGPAVGHRRHHRLRRAARVRRRLCQPRCCRAARRHGIPLQRRPLGPAGRRGGRAGAEGARGGGRARRGSTPAGARGAPRQPLPRRLPGQRRSAHRGACGTGCPHAGVPRRLPLAVPRHLDGDRAAGREPARMQPRRVGPRRLRAGSARRSRAPLCAGLRRGDGQRCGRHPVLPRVPLGGVAGSRRRARPLRGEHGGVPPPAGRARAALAPHNDHADYPRHQAQRGHPCPHAGDHRGAGRIRPAGRGGLCAHTAA